MNRFLILIMLLVCFSTPIAGVAETGHIHIRGSSTFYHILQQVAEAYMVENPGVKVLISSGGTTRGIKAVIDGTAEIGAVSAAMSDEYVKLAEEKKLKLITHVVGRGAVVPFVHPSNPVSDLTLEQLRKIFCGQIKNWKAVGGKDEPIFVTANEITRGCFETWRRCVMGKDVIVSSGALVLEPIPLRNFIASTPNAIGYISYLDVNSTVKPLSVNGVAATIETVKDLSFPIRRDYGLIIRDNASKTVLNFINFFLDPSKGQSFISKNGLAPVK